MAPNNSFKPKPLRSLVKCVAVPLPSLTDLPVAGRLNSGVRRHMEGLTLFERRVLDACLAGDDPRLDVLRMQAATAMVAEREHTGVGAYITLKIPHEAPALCAGSFILSDVNLDVAGVANGVATLLFVTDGKLDFIEFATYDDDWPEAPDLLSIGYLQWVPSSPGAFSGIPVMERDPETLSRELQEGEP